MILLRSLAAVVGVASKVGAAITKSPEPCAITYWFPFGDSYTTTGFDPNDTLPSVGNPLGNPAFPGETGGGGENFVGFDTTVYNRSLILTYDYAVGGAVIDPTLVSPITLSLPDGVDEFLVGAGKKPATAPWTSENALFSVWIGINDIGNTFYLGGDRAAFSDTLLDAYFVQVQRLVEAGGRNFLFINVPPTYRAPLIIDFFPDQLDVAKTVIEGFNSKLAARVKLFKAKNRGAKTWIWDAYTSFNTILDAPQRYGFVDDSSFGEPGDFWGNSYHPASAAHQIFAKQISELLAGTPWF
ncbi:fungal cellulose binding domain-containing protein [Mycena albidolilacea]|uniref:Fungal cellulose binding domain-containing protein n=1 Tax=Mycena albidolilacea TaxID=1033008 RepID=A0AAD7A015_9AGAR|nr:fungal cellulose binding domain-containing protein [Mycena albidolilacea]